MLEVEEWHNGYKAPSSTPTRSNQISSSLLEVETSSTTMHHLATTTSFVLLIVVATSTCFSAASISQRLSPPLNGTTTTGACLPRERDALLAFKRGITADPVGRLSSWRRGTDCCRWEGVQCARRTGHVLKLQLQIPFYYDDESRKKEGLTGRISPSLFALEHLQQLDLSVNYLEGPLPSEIGMLPNLTELNLGNNYLDGVITEQHFAHLKSLKYIDFSDNSLEVRIARGWQPPFSLKSASFRFCRMGPRFPAWLQSQTSIDSLDMSHTYLADRLPDWFATTFSMASELNFYNNQITGELPTSMKIMSVKNLYFGSNKISGQIPQLPRNLAVLEISNNNLSGPLPLSIGATNLNELVLFSNHIVGHIPESFCKWQDLYMLDLANNQFEGSFPHCFNPTILKNLLLSNNRFSGKFPSFLQGCKMLSILDLGQNNFYGRLPTWIGDLVGLEVMRLSRNNFFGSIPVKITNLRQLVHLDLASNNLSGALPQNLSRLNAMSDQGPYVLSPGFSPSEKYNISVVTKRKELFYDNGGMLFVAIDLSSNYLTGEIPRDITSLHELVSLNLSGNCLSGKIPHSIGEMHLLESLDLSRNKLSGKIPSSLSKLTFLGFLDLSYNNLTGTIPLGSQLDTLYSGNPYMYSGNSDLCGPPLPKNCSSYYVPQQGHLRTIEPSSKIEPFYIGLAFGFIPGIWVVFCTLLFKKAWRAAYFCLFDNLCDKAYVIVVVAWARLARKTTAN
ncbi:hypothetical protein QOZ80_6AG0543580 [Eleusine coracana subsp. coracana]|nr:hypothetical protein QOZ80_6AG0543580 [Eleusine coracana subsp. coracana]